MSFVLFGVLFYVFVFYFIFIFFFVFFFICDRFLYSCFFFFSSIRRHTRCALVTGVQTCALPICGEGFGLADELAAYIDIGRPRAHREAGDQRAFDQLVRIVADDLAVLAGAGLGFIGVDDEEIGTALAGLLGHEAPLHAGREARAAAAAQTRRFDRLDDLVLADSHQRLGIIPVPALLRRLQVPGLEPVDVGEDAVLVGERSDGHAPASVTPATAGAQELRSRRNPRTPCSWVPASAGMTRTEEHTSELQSLMRISYAVVCLKKKNKKQTQ